MKLIGLRTVYAAVVSLALAGCGGGGGDGGGSGGSGGATSFSVTVTLTGLTANGLVLVNNAVTPAVPVAIPAGTTTVVVSANLANGASYNIVGQGTPPGIACIPVTTGANVGTIAGANVTIPYSCAPTFPVSGSISGLTAAGLQVRLFPDVPSVATLAGFNVAPAQNATSYQFPVPVRGDVTYSARIVGQPAGLTCLFANNTIDISAPMNNAAATAPITCTGSAPPQGSTFSLSASFTNLAGLGSVTVQNNGGTAVAIPTANTPVTIATGLATGTAYTLAVGGVPGGFACVPVTAGANVGTVGSANVTVAFSCSATYPVSVNVVSGAPTGLQLRLFPAAGNTSAAFNLAPTVGGTHTFGLPVRGDITYAIGIIAQPAGQNCLFGNNSTTVAGPMNGSAQTVGVRCTATVGGSIAAAAPGVLNAGLPAGLTLSLDDNGVVQSLTVAAGSSSFTFPTAITSGNDYSVSIAGVPAGVSCTVSLGKGIANSNVSSIAVRCMDNPTNPLTGVYTLAPAVTGQGRFYFAFFADGTYTFVSRADDALCNFTNVNGTFGNNGNGVEYGIYNYSSTTGAFTIKYAAVDSNGGCGMVDASISNINDPARYFTGTITKSGNNATLTYVDDNSQTVNLPLASVASTPSTIVGAFVPTTNNGQFIAFHPDSTTPTPVNMYVVPETQFSGIAAPPRQEVGCYTFASGNLNVSVANTCLPDGLAAYDFNGTSGLIESGTTAGPFPITINTANQIALGDTILNRTVPN